MFRLDGQREQTHKLLCAQPGVQPLFSLRGEKIADLLKPPLRRFLFREYAITHIETRF